MYHRVLIALLFLGSVAVCETASSQELFALGFQSGQIQVFTLNPVTGTLTSRFATGAPNAGSGETAFDPDGRRLFFQSTNSLLYTVNIDTGAVSTAPIVGCCFFLQYDSVSNTLFAVGFENSQVQIFTLNPVTGALTSRFATGAPNAGSGETAFDPAGHRLFFQSTDNLLYTVNIDTGAVSTAPIVGCCFFMQYDSVSSTLFAVGFENGQVQIFTLNPVTGALTSRFATGAPNAGSGETAFDPAGRRLFFQSTNDLFYTANIDTGVVSTAPIVGCCFFLLFAAAPVGSIPVLSPFGLLILGATLAAAGVIVRSNGAS